MLRDFYKGVLDLRERRIKALIHKAITYTEITEAYYQWDSRLHRLRREFTITLTTLFIAPTAVYLAWGGTNTYIPLVGMVILTLIHSRFTAYTKIEAAKERSGNLKLYKAYGSASAKELLRHYGSDSVLGLAVFDAQVVKSGLVDDDGNLTRIGKHFGTSTEPNVIYWYRPIFGSLLNYISFHNKPKWNT